MAGYLSLRVDLAGLDELEARIEAAEAALFDAGALSVTLTDAVDDAILEPAPGEVRLWPQTVLQALFPAGMADAEPIVVLAGALDLPATRISVEHIADRVWEREWLKDFHAMRFGRRLWIVPNHEPLPEDPAAVSVRLDPGLAFGTGTHPSTALCLAWLDSLLPAQATVIDYGCGSGVLAIAAAMLGAGSAQAFDIDPQALIATHDNAVANHVENIIQVHDAASLLKAPVDVVLANILAGTLIELAPRLVALLKPGGQLVLAGILKQQVHEVRAGFAPWLELGVFAEREGWSALSGTLRGVPA
ncbi:MAG TPA: 50S ribosomal protein L11 methyltransferase [Steroidobacteraceae bacterium]|nr:50S ribosomal protein L11 methyltransferase [Steroidobacteraceae bacterium]